MKTALILCKTYLSKECPPLPGLITAIYGPRSRTLIFNSNIKKDGAEKCRIWTYFLALNFKFVTRKYFSKFTLNHVLQTRFTCLYHPCWNENKLIRWGKNHCTLKTNFAINKYEVFHSKLHLFTFSKKIFQWKLLFLKHIKRETLRENLPNSEFSGSYLRLRIQSECAKILTRKTPNMGTLYAMKYFEIFIVGVKFVSY